MNRRGGIRRKKTVKEKNMDIYLVKTIQKSQFNYGSAVNIQRKITLCHFVFIYGLVIVTETKR